jgi:hypothetical protein
MGDMADYYIDQQLFRDPSRDFVTSNAAVGSMLDFINILNNDYWITKDGRKLEPSQMDAGHIESVMKLLKGKVFVDNHKKARNLFYVYCAPPQGEHAQDAFDEEQSRALGMYDWSTEEYFQNVVEPSTLWQCLLCAKARHTHKLQKAIDKNKGVIDW